MVDAWQCLAFSVDEGPRGTVFCSFSFGDVRVNDLTGGGYDPITDTAELKVCPVRIERAESGVVE